MKKLAFGMAAAIAAVCIGASSVFAASQSVPFGAAPDSAAGSGYVDSNGDSICDNRISGGCGNYIDADGNGVCDNRLSGSCDNYVDADGDGVCDHCLNSRCTAGTTGGCAQNRHGNRGAGYTPQQVNDMPMSQLRQILEQLQGGASDQSSGHQGQGSHGHHGGHD